MFAGGKHSPWQCLPPPPAATHPPNPLPVPAPPPFPPKMHHSAQIGFFALIALEAIAGKGIFQLLGISTGNGLGFEF